MRAPEVLCIALVGHVSLVAAAAMHKRQGGLDSCTQTDLNELGSCIDSALSVFYVTFEAEYSSSFDYGGIASEINSLQSGLTSLGVTLTSFLADPSSFAATAQPGSTYGGPFVSDIISSYSEYTETRTDGSGSVFSFKTSNFTPQPTVSPTSISPMESTSAEGSAPRSSGGISTLTSVAVTGPITPAAGVTASTGTVSSRSSSSAQAAAATSSAAGSLSTKDTGAGLAAFAMVLLSMGYQTLVALVGM